MIVQSLETLPPERIVSADAWTSRRLLLRNAGMGFSFHDTLVRAGSSIQMRYTNHVEAVYCIRGTGRIECLDSSQVFEIKPGTIYAVNEHEEHILHADSEMQMICVFNPPLAGSETHDETGSYPLIRNPHQLARSVG